MSDLDDLVCVKHRYDLQDGCLYCETIVRIRKLFAERYTREQVREMLLKATGNAIIECSDCLGAGAACHYCNGSGAVGLVADAILKQADNNKETTDVRESSEQVG